MCWGPLFPAPQCDPPTSLRNPATLPHRQAPCPSQKHRRKPGTRASAGAEALEGGAGAYPRAKTSECLEKGSLSSSVSGDSWRMISGARWHSQPFWMRSLSSRLESKAQSESCVAAPGGQAPRRPQPLCHLCWLSCISLLGHCLTLYLRLRPSGSGTGKAGLERDRQHPNHPGSLRL